LVKKFNYRGMSVSELEKLSLDKILAKLNARQRRSLSRGITDGKRKVIEELGVDLLILIFFQYYLKLQQEMI